jgi:hypothetical protein
MSASIAPERIETAAPLATEYRSRAASHDSIPPTAPAANPQTSTEAPAPASLVADPLPPLPLPPKPPGEAFAAAVMSGALSPKPATPQEMFLRLGGNWSPPDSSLHLTDRLI